MHNDVTNQYVNEFIRLIKSLRCQKNLTLEDLSNSTGIHRTALGLIERGKKVPTLISAHQIANALDSPLSELVRDSELVVNGKISEGAILEQHVSREVDLAHLRNQGKFKELTGLDSPVLVKVIDNCYQILDTIDQQLIGFDSPPIEELVELANLSSMIGNLFAGGLADYSEGIYTRNRPHAYPDLLPTGEGAVNLELKMALETNKPKGHLPKAGNYITIRYVLGDGSGNYTRGKANRGNKVWIWEVKVGKVKVEDFSLSNTAGDSGKTAVIKTEVFNNMPLVYYVPKYLPYAKRDDETYPSFN